MTTARDIVNGALSAFGIAGIDTSSLSATTVTAGTVVIDALRINGISTVDTSGLAAATATVREVITNAMRLLNLISIDGAPDASEAENALTAFNEMRYGWLLEGVDTTPSDATLDTTFPLPKAFTAGVTSMLAARLAESYGAALPPQIGASAQSCWEALKNAYVTTANALAELNNMMASWATLGVDVGYTSALSMSSTVPLKDDFVGALKAMLAARIAERAGKPVAQETKQAAVAGWQTLKIAYQFVPNALRALNDMMFSWKADGVDTSHSTLSMGTTFPLDTEYENGVKAMLAVRIAREIGMQLDPVVASRAANAWEALQAAYIEAPEADFDSTLVYMPSQRYVDADS